MGQRRLSVVLCFFLFVACSGTGASRAPSPSTLQPTDQPSPTAVASPTAKPTPTPAPAATVSPPATAPPRTGPPTAEVERDGILVELWLPEEVATIGERFFAHVRITNTGVQRVFRDASDCVTPSSVSVDYTVALPAGNAWSGIAGTYKKRLLSEREYGIRHFLDMEHVGLLSYFCSDVLITKPFGPREALEHSVAWDIGGYQFRPVVPGNAVVTAKFGFWPTEDSAGDPESLSVAAGTPILIAGTATSERPLVDYVDLTLAEPRFAEWLEQRPPDTWINTHSVAWPNEEGEYPPDPCYERATDGALDIGLYREVPGIFEFGSVSLDLPSGELLGVRFEPEGTRVYCE